MKITSALSAVAIAGMLVVTADYATMAATGGSFILGHANSANQSTKLTNTGTGPVLKLYTTHPATRAPLGVNSSVKVAYLNADKVDGKHASQLGVRTRVYTKSVNVTAVSGFTISLPSVAAGRYLTTVNGWIYGPASSTLECYLLVPSTSQFVEDWLPADSTGFHTPGTAGVVVVPTTQTLTYTCQGASGDYRTFDGQPIQISLTRIDALTTGTPTLPRKSGRVGAAH